ncbi:MAG: hypothetical protein K2O97_07590 [Acetatifactor sp.]|nr:hypothetical protein [Acetatifactor sp.]
MNTNAIYTIHEDGKIFYFYSKYAGGFSYPFEVAGYLNSLKYTLQKTKIRDQNIYVSPLLLQMRGTCCFPDALKDTLLFETITEKVSPAENTLENIPFLITLDINRYTVTFHFNDHLDEYKNLPDITFPCFEPSDKYSGGRFMEESLSILAESENISFGEDNEKVFQKLVRKAIAEQERNLHA